MNCSEMRIIMRYRKLGNTGLWVSELGFGTIPILSGSVPVLPDYYNPDLNKAIDIMEYAFHLGCNFYDTAVPEEYGDAEYKLGRFADQIGRDKIIIADKARFFDGNEIYNAVIQSCENLGTKPDIYFVHQVDLKNQDRVFERYGALDALCDLKAEGKIRFSGIASHYYDVLLRGAKDDRVDILQGSGNILECGMLRRMAEERQFAGKGFILNKVYAAGLLTKFFTVDDLIGGILKYPFSCALIGLGTMEQVNAAMGKEIEPKDISFEKVLEVLQTTFEPIPCTRCQRCICQFGTEIHTAFRQYNYYYLGKNFWALKKLNMNIENAYENCFRCMEQECMSNCPMGLHIPEMIGKIKELVENHI